MNGFVKVNVVDRAVLVEFGNGKRIKFEDCWLRDHCRCSECYNHDSFQRSQHILDIPDSRLAHLQFDTSRLNVVWDDKHKSTYEADFLAQFDYAAWAGARRLRPVLWKGDVSDRATTIHVDKFIGTEDGAKAVFQSLLDYGVAFVDGLDVSLEGTEVVAKALGGVQSTMFGGMWSFTTRFDHADTAYTNIPLALHNDNTYFTEAAGLLILHCFEHTNGTGGETTLADGFYGATELKKSHPEDFEFLTKFQLDAEYIEDGHHHKFSAPVIQIDDKTKELKQIRYNVYDRSAMAFESSEECRAYYRSLRNLASYYETLENQWKFKLVPGVAMIIDNFRVLHGRAGFSGTRVMGGSYVARSDWLDRARTLGLIQ